MSANRNANIAAHLPAMAGRKPYQAAVVFPQGRDPEGRVSYTLFNFRQLDSESDLLARALKAYGIGRGARTVLMVPPSLEFFALTFALFKIGAVPVMIDPGMGLKPLKSCLREAQPHAFIGIPKAHAARVILGWPRFQRKVTVGSRVLWGGASLEEIRKKHGGDGTFAVASMKPEETAAILFTSGSTGVPKGAVYTHGIFSAQVRILKRLYGIEPGEVDLATFPLFALFAPALGMTAIVPDMDPRRPAKVDGAKIFEAIQNFGVTNMFGSPALLDRVGRYGEARNLRLPSLMRVISAGAPVHGAILERFLKLLSPETQVFTPYGATEALPVSSIGATEILSETAAKTATGAGICVGRPVDEAVVKIIGITEDPLEHWENGLEVPQGEIGEIVVKGPMVTSQYYNRDQATRLAKIQDREMGGFYHRMGDVGYLDADGRLWFCGRKSQRVPLKNRTLYTIPCEGVFNVHPSVYRSALVGVPDANGILEPVLCVELEVDAKHRDRQTLLRELLAMGAEHEHTREIKRVVFHPAFPVDTRHNAKIFREKLAAWVRG